MEIQWYPGHMAKTKRIIKEDLRKVDAVCEMLDARIPLASRNPDIDRLAKDKPRLILLNRADQADPGKTALWSAYFQSMGYSVLTCNSKSGAGLQSFPVAVRALLRDKLRRYAEKGMAGRPAKVMVVGIPNVGKSSFINRIAGKRSARTEDRPGITRKNEWFKVDAGIEMLDTPGILPPKLESRRAGMLLAFTGAVKDQILDLETLACGLFATLSTAAPDAIKERYGVDAADFAPAVPEPEAPVDPTIALGYEMLCAAAKKRGFLLSGGELDTGRMAKVLLDEFRSGKLGRITLELPPENDEIVPDAKEPV